MFADETDNADGGRDGNERTIRDFSDSKRWARREGKTSRRAHCFGPGWRQRPAFLLALATRAALATRGTGRAARVDALLRRSGMSSAVVPAELSVGDLTLNEDSHEVSRAGEPLELTNTEFEVLRYLMENPNVVLSKGQILDCVWSYDFGGNSNVVELYISYLRKKVDRSRSPMIHTVRGAGYILRPARETP
ncbi:winged helix-turn-helix domain-containing protein [Buchananella felis]|uniref:winged helix-turn-helix domain-containing protein n=1 Tax=Buchananella felis TaxID=3231492 RepID=UPI003526DBFA